VGQALAARTYADLAMLTADLPAGLAAAEPSYQPDSKCLLMPRTGRIRTALAMPEPVS